MELFITMSIVGILVAIAVPSFGTLFKSNRITTQGSDFQLALMLARSEALTRISKITICRSSNGTSCAGSGGWEQGWIIFTDDDDDAVVDGGETVLRFVLDRRH